MLQILQAIATHIPHPCWYPCTLLKPVSNAAILACLAVTEIFEIWRSSAISRGPHKVSVKRMRPVFLPFEEVFVYNAKSMPFLQIAYIVSWLLIARPRHSSSSAQTLGTRAWSLKTDGHDLVYTHGSGYLARRPREACKPYHVVAPHVLQQFYSPTELSTSQWREQRYSISRVWPDSTASGATKCGLHE